MKITRSVIIACILKFSILSMIFSFGVFAVIDCSFYPVEIIIDKDKLSAKNSSRDDLKRNDSTSANIFENLQYVIISEDEKGSIERFTFDHESKCIIKKPVKKLYLLNQTNVIDKKNKIITKIGKNFYSGVSKPLPESSYGEKFSSINDRSKLYVADIIIEAPGHSLFSSYSNILNWKGDLVFIIGIIIISAMSFVAFLILNFISSYFIKEAAIKSILGDQTVRYSVAGLLTVIIPVIIYNLFLLRNFFPITEGWWSYIATLILDGKIPYKDFYLYLPPVYPYFISFFVKIFGIEIIKLRILGLIMQVLTAVILYLCLTKLFNPLAAAISALLSMFIYMTSFTAFMSYDYNQFVFFLALLITYVIIGQDFLKGRDILTGLFAGFLTAVLIFTKQTTGIIIFISVYSGLLINRMHNRNNRLVLSYLIASITGSFLFIIILWNYNLLHLFFQNVYVDASISKSGGNCFQILYMWIPRIFRGNNKVLFFTLIGILTALMIIIKLADYKDKKISLKNLYPAFILIMLTTLLAILIPYLYRDVHQIINSFYYGINKSLAGISIAMIIPLMILLPIMTNRSKAFTIMLCFSFAMIMNSAASGAVITIGTIPAISLLVGLILERRNSLIIYGIFIFVTVIYMYGGSSAQYKKPYAWGGYTCGDVRDTVPVGHEVKVLNGLKIDKDIKLLLNQLTENKNFYGKTAFCFPNIPIFYIITNTKSITFAPFHWYDVASDEISKMDAERIFISNPEFIFWNSRDDNSDMIKHEKMFRNGKPCGQREIKLVIEIMIRNNYRSISNIELNNSNKIKILQHVTIQN